MTRPKKTSQYTGQSAEAPVLIAQLGALDGRRWMIDRPLTVGREPECDVVIPDRQVSRFHARILPTTDGMILEDLGSKNGTYVHGKMIGESVRLVDGDSFQIALVQQFIFLNSDATMPMEGLTFRPERRGKLYLDPRSRRVWVGAEEVLPPLSVPQFRLLQAVYDRSEQVVSRQDLISAIWGDDEAVGVSEQALDALIRRLRDRLGSIDGQHVYLVTVRGHGLRLDNPNEE